MVINGVYMYIVLTTKLFMTGVYVTLYCFLPEFACCLFLCKGYIWYKFNGWILCYFARMCLNDINFRLNQILLERYRTPNILLMIIYSLHVIFWLAGLSLKMGLMFQLFVKFENRLKAPWTLSTFRPKTANIFRKRL